ncbi:MAG TPA: MASE1 domain-containing protein [Nitrospiraceae bacterium]|nr:MASE1 domain-containing protein [Nitrospiraceae bacterium]
MSKRSVMRLQLGTSPVVVFFLLAALYFLAGKLGLLLAFVHASATAVWPPTGIALAAFLLLGYRVWPGIFLGAFLVNLTTAGSVATTIGIAIGNTLEGLAGAYLVNRFAHGSHAFDRPPDVFKFAALAALTSTTVSPFFGVTSLALGGYADWTEYGHIWLTWWLGDAGGALIVAPVLLLWSQDTRVRWTLAQAKEAGLVFVTVVLVGLAVFGGVFPITIETYPLAFMCIPVLVWTAFRFGPRETATAILLLSGMAIWGTLHGLGPFVLETQNESLLMLQVFMGVTAVMILALASGASEQRRAEEAKAYQATIVDSSDDAIIGKTLEGLIVSWNRGAVHIFGYAAEEVLGRPITILIPPDRLDEEPTIIERVRQGERIEHFETVRRRKDGQEVDVSLTISPIKDETGQIIGVSKTARDITERQRAKEERKRLQGDLDDVQAQVKALRGLLPICASCKKIRGDGGHWHNLEKYIEEHSEASFSHGICPACMQKLYPEYAQKQINSSL